VMATTCEQSQEELKTLVVQPKQQYRHYKGGKYEVVATSVEESTGVILVTYRSLGDGFVWTRPFHQWFESVWWVRWGHPRVDPRFRLIDDPVGIKHFTRDI
jgi:hypothetical protein